MTEPLSWQNGTLAPTSDPDTNERPDDGARYPTSTPVSDMTPTHQAAYWKGIARKHEHRYKELGDVPSLLEDAAQWRNHECGESTDRQDLKESDVLELASRLTFKALLSHNGVQGADLDLVMESMNAAAFIDDGQLNVALLATHAARFAPSGEAI